MGLGYAASYMCSHMCKIEPTQALADPGEDPGNVAERKRVLLSSSGAPHALALV